MRDEHLENVRRTLERGLAEVLKDIKTVKETKILSIDYIEGRLSRHLDVFQHALDELSRSCR